MLLLCITFHKFDWRQRIELPRPKQPRKKNRKWRILCVNRSNNKIHEFLLFWWYYFLQLIVFNVALLTLSTCHIENDLSFSNLIHCKRCSIHFDDDLLSSKSGPPKRIHFIQLTVFRKWSSTMSCKTKPVTKYLRVHIYILDILAQHIGHMNILWSKKDGSNSL